MIIEEFHFEIKRRWDALNSLHKRTLTPLVIDNAINEVTQDYIEMFVHGNRLDAPYKMDIEWSRKRSDMTQPFIISFPVQPLLTATSVGSGIFSYDFTTTIRTYRSYLSSSFEVSGCEGVFQVDIVRHENLEFSLEDFHTRPSRIWKKALGAIRDDKLYLYTNNLFTPQGLKLTYVREPAKVCLGNYGFIPTIENPNPVGTKPKVESDVPKAYHSLLIDMVVQKLERLYGQVQQYQTSELEISKIK